MNLDELHDKAMVALEERDGEWRCVPCWAKAAGLTSPQDQQHLSALARTLLNNRPRRVARRHL